jgi:hypothetical protein
VAKDVNVRTCKRRQTGGLALYGGAAQKALAKKLPSTACAETSTSASLANTMSSSSAETLGHVGLGEWNREMELAGQLLRDAASVVERRSTNRLVKVKGPKEVT